MNGKINKKGFTIAEMVTTVAIIGTVAGAVALPGFLRMRLQVNMELLKHNLRVIGQTMNDYLIRNQKFPDDIANLGTSSEEITITANLSSIQQKGFTTTYHTDATRSTYTIRACTPDNSACLVKDPGQLTLETHTPGGGGSNPDTGGCNL